jgi:TonB family protein
MPSFGKYEILGELGRGGMGVVYRARDTDLGREVALKVIQATPHTDLRQAAELARRFEIEAKATAALQHPHIVTLFDRGEIQGYRYLAMAFVRGQTLEAVLDQRRVLPLDEAVKLLKPVAAALDYAHSQRVIHRDIKPANIMVQPDGHVLVMDFGIAKALAVDSGTSSMMLGSPQYMAPEQLRFEAPTPAVDQWALAVMAYYMLTGQRPFAGLGDTIFYAILNHQPTAPSQLNASLPPAVSDVLLRALRKQPGERYLTCTEFVNELDQARRGAPGPAVAGPEFLVDSGKKSGLRSVGMAAGALALVYALGMGAVQLLKQGTKPDAAATGNRAAPRSEARPGPSPQTPPVNPNPAPQKPNDGTPVESSLPAPGNRNASGVYRPGNGVTAAVVLRSAEPDYSEEARKAKFQGTVVLSLVVDEKGIPRDIRVIRPLGLGLDEKAIEAVQKWRFQPGRKNGRAVPVVADAQVNFRLRPEAKPDPKPSNPAAVVAPKVTRKVEPVYSPEAREARREGVVKLAFVVNTEGVPQSIRVVSGLGYGLDEKAVEALRLWRYQAATRDGRPEEFPLEVELPFRLPANRLSVGGNIQAANLIQRVAPAYPPLAKQARIQGTVRFTAVIGTDGLVQSLQLVSGHPLLVPSATEAVKQWRYNPTLVNGAPVEVLTTIDVNFTLTP